MRDDSAARQLSQAAKAVEHCVWPGCSDSLVQSVGPLCWDHASIVAAAVNRQLSSSVTWAQAAAADRRTGRADEQAERQKARGDQPGWIYYVRVGDRVKIGYSRDVKHRMRAYPPQSHLLAVHPGTPQLETEMHQRFAGSLTAGREWFRETPDLIEHIGEVVAQFGEPTKHRHHFRTSAQPMRASRSG